MNQGNNNGMNFNLPQDNTQLQNNQILNNIYQNTNVEQSNNYYQSLNEINIKPPKKKKIGLVIGITLGVVATILTVIIVLNNKNNLTSNNDNNNGGEDLVSQNIKYYDNTREIKDTYTFEEAVGRFTFSVGNTSLIFTENENVKLESLLSSGGYYNGDVILKFVYKHDTYKILNALYVAESSSQTLDEFINNESESHIIDSNDEYVFGYWISNINSVENYKYYFAKKIGDMVYYGHHISSTLYDEEEMSIFLSWMKEFFSCLSKDDGKEPYIYDKIVNVPVVLNKRISDIKYISGIFNYYSDHYVILETNDLSLNVDTYHVNLKYDGKEIYNATNWQKNIDENIKYFEENGYYTIGVNEKNNIQIFEIDIYDNEVITNKQEFNNFINKFLIDK